MAKPFDAKETARATRKVIGEDIQETALAILSKVVRATPVGNPTLWQNPDSAPPGYVGGHARRNWIVSFNTPVDGVQGDAGAGPGEGATQEAIQQGTTRLARSARTTSSRSLRRIFIQNNVPYITRLNAGHSTQAPANFVEKAVQAGRNVDNTRRVIP